MHIKRSILAKVNKLRDCESGVILVEFAYVLPLFVILSFTGIEVSALAIANMRVSQIAMTVADNMSRIAESVPLTAPQLREVDINDTLLGARIQGGTGLPLFENGRVIVSSLQQNASGRQTIKWQRCKGLLNVVSEYGVEGVTQPNAPATNGFQGMGTGTSRVQAEANSAVIFVEVTYTYKPLVASSLIGPRTLKKEAAFYVRDDRDLTQLFNPNPASSVSTCNLYNTSF
jgi:Flp pilus assembly protein TadG